MKTQDKIELRTAEDTPDLRSLEGAWRRAALACNAEALDNAEDALRALSTHAANVSMEEWQRMDAACGGAGTCTMQAPDLPAGTVYICLPTTD